MAIVTHQVTIHKERLDSDYVPVRAIQGVRGDILKLESNLETQSKLVVVLGNRGQGKTSTVMRLSENIHNKTNKRVYILGYADVSLPPYFIKIKDINDAKDDGVVIIDEAQMVFSSRRSQSNNNLDIRNIVSVSRKKNLTIFFISHFSKALDIDLFGYTDVFVLKYREELQLERERKEVRKLYDKAMSYFKDIHEQDRKKYAYIYTDELFEGFVKIDKASFWNEEISRSF